MTSAISRSVARPVIAALSAVIVLGTPAGAVPDLAETGVSVPPVGSPSALGPSECEGGRVVASVHSTSLKVLLGPCAAAEPAQAAGAGLPASSPDPAPQDCLAPGVDDHCEAWTAPRYDGPWNGDDWPGFGSFDRTTTLLASPSGDLVFVGGTSTYGSGDAYDADFVEVAYSASTGQPVWTQQFPGDGNLTLAYETTIALSSDGDVLYALGEVAEPGVYDYSAEVVAFDARTGGQLWHADYDLYPFSMTAGSVHDADGAVSERVYVAGAGSATLDDGTDVNAGRLIAIDTTSPGHQGEVVWSADYVGDSPNGSLFMDAAVSPDGGTVFAGGGDNRSDGLRMDFATVAFHAADGHQLWEAHDTLTQPAGFYGNNGVSDMAVSPDGSRVFVTGFDPVAGNNLLDLSDTYSAILTIAHDTATGAALWRGSYLGPVEGEKHFYFSLFEGNVGVTPDGQTVAVTGGLGSEGSGTVAYDTGTGHQRWGVESKDPVQSNCTLIGLYPVLAVSGDQVFVSNPRGVGCYTSVSYVTMAYAAGSGATNWTARFSTGGSYPAGIATSPDRETVYVTGISRTLGTATLVDPNVDSWDIETVAYAAKAAA